MNSSLTNLQQRALDLSMSYLDMAARQYGVGFDTPSIHFDLKGTAAGQVRIDKREWRIRYNARLLEQYAERFLKRTVPHEVAHLVAYALHGHRIRPHGREWKAIMAQFGADSSRCHNFETQDCRVRKLKQFTYHCACQRHNLSSIRHNRVQRGALYLCQKCKQPLNRVR